MTSRVTEFAIERYRDFIGNLLDDPSDLLHPNETTPPAEAIAELRALAADLGLDYDALCLEIGTPNEVDRLQRIERGTWR